MRIRSFTNLQYVDPDDQWWDVRATDQVGGVGGVAGGGGLVRATVHLE